MAGIGIARKPKPFGSNKIKDQNIFFIIYRCYIPILGFYWRVLLLIKLIVLSIKSLKNVTINKKNAVNLKNK